MLGGDAVIFGTCEAEGGAAGIREMGSVPPQDVDTAP